MIADTADNGEAPGDDQGKISPEERAIAALNEAGVGDTWAKKGGNLAGNGDERKCQGGEEESSGIELAETGGGRPETCL